jgi:LmbE family N-acetylglucosaminyl deacetylase
MKLLIVSPHPDDETLGAGGTLLRSKKEGNNIFWLNFTDKSEDYGYSAEEVKIRRSEIQRVEKAYSFDGFYNLGLKPCFLSKYPEGELIDKTAKILDKVKPEVVILPFKNDPHSDHRIIFELVYSCIKVFRAHFLKETLMMEILSETEFSSSDNGFVPNYFVDISAHLEKKISIMQNYKKELQDHPFPRSISNIRALATYRGAIAGCKYAESFILIKKII